MQNNFELNNQEAGVLLRALLVSQEYERAQENPERSEYQESILALAERLSSRVNG